MFVHQFFRNARKFSRLGSLLSLPSGSLLTRMIALPVALYMLHEAKSSCIFGFGSPSISRNKLAGRVNNIYYPANSPIEDRQLVHQLTAVDGYVAAVFDGHGGWQMSQFAMNNMVGALERALTNNKSKYTDEKEMVVESLKQAFDDVEGKFLYIARNGYAAGFPRMGRVGSCALVVLVINNRVYAANAGDSQALVLEQKDGNLVHTKLNKKLNANSKKEQARLRSLFPGEPDVVECRREKSCYVKGRLQPTRAFGDFRLKYPYFNNPKEFGSELDYQTRLKVFTGPYITHQPEIKVVDITGNHKLVVLGCDGLWDELSKQEVTDIANKALRTKKQSELSKMLLEAALEKAAHSNTLTLSELKKIPQGDRRNLHDDITIITLDLEKQFS